MEREHASEGISKALAALRKIRFSTAANERAAAKLQEVIGAIRDMRKSYGDMGFTEPHDVEDYVVIANAVDIEDPGPLTAAQIHHAARVWSEREKVRANIVAEVATPGLSYRAVAKLYNDLTGAKNDHKWIAKLVSAHDLRLPLENGKITERSVVTLVRSIPRKKRKATPKTPAAKETCPKCGQLTHKLIGADKVCKVCFLEQHS